MFSQFLEIAGSTAKFIFICLEVLLLFNLLIAVHELGHYLAARWRGLVVEKFRIWFGKPIWSRTIDGVEYSLGWIPAGGFVALPQMAPMEIMEGEVKQDRSQLPPVSAMDKIIVAFAGPLFSMGLAVFFACVVWVVGHPYSEADKSVVVGYLPKESPAASAGMQVGDKILSVDGHPVNRFSGAGNSISWRVISSVGETIRFEVDRAGSIQVFDVKPVIEEKKGWWQRRPLRRVMISPAQTPMIASIYENSPAAKAGLKRNDLVLAMNGSKLLHPIEVANWIDENPDKPISLTIERDGTNLDIQLTPRVPRGGDKPRLGIGWEIGGRFLIDHPNPIEQIEASVDAMVNTIVSILTPKSGVGAQHLSGPLGIMRVYYLLFESEQGWRLVLWFSVILNVNLALMNLLPIPVLDGGHILLATIEGIFKRPVPGRFLEVIQSACGLLIVSYILYVTFFDAQDLVPSKPPAPIVFDPQ